jgi:hypothetical protein
MASGHKIKTGVFHKIESIQKLFTKSKVSFLSEGELLEIRLLDNHLLNTFGSKSTARHEIDQLLESRILAQLDSSS